MNTVLKLNAKWIMERIETMTKISRANRTIHQTAKAALVSMLVVWAGLQTAQAQTGGMTDSDPAQIKAEISRTKKDITKAESDLRKTDSLARTEMALAQKTEERAVKDRERREKEIAELQGRASELRKQIETQKSVAARSGNGIGEITARQKNLARNLANWCDSLLVRVQKSVPLDVEPRLERVRALKNDLLSGSSTAEEGISRLASIIKEEIKSGDEVALLNRPFTLKGGETVNAQVLKLGNQLMLFMDEEGKHFGFVERKGDGWETREVEGFQDRLAVKKAIEVKAAKQPPQLVPLAIGTRVELKNGGN